MLAGILFLESLAHSIHPTPYTPLTPSLGPILNINHSTKDCFPAQAVDLSCGRKGAGTPNPNTILPSVCPIEA